MRRLVSFWHAVKRLPAVACGGALLACGSTSASAGPGGSSDAGTVAPLDASADGAPVAADGAPSNDAEVPDASDVVQGTVVDAGTKQPLGGRLVFIGDVRVMTDASGRFSVRDVQSAYDAIIVEPDGRSVTLYRSLTRHDPVLLHAPSPIAMGSAYAGSIGGTFTGMPFPLHGSDRADLWFLSAETHSHITLYPGGALGEGPGYRIGAQWNGPSSTAGRLFGLGVVGLQPDGGVFAVDGGLWFGTQMVTLDSGGAIDAGLALDAIGTQNVTVTLHAPTAYPVTQLQAYDRFPGIGGEVSVANLSTPAVPVTLALADLSGVGGVACLLAIHTTTASDAVLRTETCGAPPGAQASLALQSPPQLASPDRITSVGLNDVLSWTLYPNGIYALRFAPSDPSNALPAIAVYTASTSGSWPDLAAQGIAFPTGAAYTVTTEGIGPFASLDDAVAPTGMAAATRAETRWSQSAAKAITGGP
jgi:hypothetical protein